MVTEHHYRKITTGIKQLERNPAVLGQFVMWAEYLQKTRLFTAYVSLGLSSV